MKEYMIEVNKDFLKNRIKALKQARHLICESCEMKYYPGGCACNLEYDISKKIESLYDELEKL